MTITLNIVDAAIVPGFQTSRLGAGGFVLGKEFADDGAAAAKTDVGGAYYRAAGSKKWRQVCTPQGFGLTGPVGGETGVWEIAIAPSDSSRLYMWYTDINSPTQFRIYRSDDAGRTWIYLNNSPVTHGASPNNGASRLSNQKMAVDPNNPDIVYTGTGVPSYPDTGCHWTNDAGVTWTKISAITDPTQDPGVAGIVFDPSYGTVTVAGQLRTARCIIGSSGIGIWETRNGGQSHTKVSTPTTPSTSVSHTTTQNDSMIIVNVWGGGGGNASTGISDTSSLTWTLRAQHDDGYGYYISEYWAFKPTAGETTITVTYADGGIGNTVAVFSVKDVDTVTPFDSGGPAYAASGSPTLTTTNANDFVFALCNSNNAGADAGWTRIQGQTANYWLQEYKVVSATGSFTSSLDSGFQPMLNCIIDALRQKAGGTIALDGTPAYASSGAAQSPGTIWTAQIDYKSGSRTAGTYWAQNGSSGLWRYSDVAVAGTFAWDRMDGQGGLPLGWPGSYGNAVCVDPRPGHSGKVTVVGPHQFWFGHQTINGNDAAASVSWEGTTGGHTPTPITSRSIGWLASAGQAAVGDMKVHPITGEYWGASGLGVLVFPATLNYSDSSYDVSYKWESVGIEELVSLDVICMDGSKYPIALVGDRGAIRTAMPGYPPTNNYSDGYDSDGWAGDFAWGTGYCAMVVWGGAAPLPSAYSINYGVTWTPFVTDPMPGNAAYAGSIAVGSYTSTTVANAVVVPGSGSRTPRYTVDNGQTWHDTDLPAANYMAGTWSRAKPIAASRDVAGTFYAYAPGYGLYKSINDGQNWTQKWSGSVSAANGVQLFVAPGHPDQLFLGGLYSSAGIYFTPDAGTTAPVSIDANITFVVTFTLGKTKPGSSYPTIYLCGTKAGDSGFFMCTDFDPNNIGTLTWTKIGTLLDIPSVHSMDTQQCMRGDWYTYGNFYLPFNSTGNAMFSLNGA